MRLLLLLFALTTFSLSAIGNEQANRSIVYEEGFVWALAEKLADDLLQFQEKNGVSLSEGERGEMGMQYSILYHNYLVKCDGPLPALAEIVAPYKPLSEASSATYLSTLNKSAWAVLETWRAKTLLPLLDTLASGKYSFFPSCIVPGFLAQNSIPGINSK